jgi:hypothetical protein
LAEEVRQVKKTDPFAKRLRAELKPGQRESEQNRIGPHPFNGFFSSPSRVFSSPGLIANFSSSLEKWKIPVFKKTKNFVQQKIISPSRLSYCFNSNSDMKREYIQPRSHYVAQNFFPSRFAAIRVAP